MKGQDTADANRFVDQGQVIVQATSIFASQEYGIGASATTDAAGNSLPGPVRNLPVENNARQLPGVVLGEQLAWSETSKVAFASPVADKTTMCRLRSLGSSIIQFLGAKQPSGIGVRIEHGAAPTLMNNVISNTNNCRFARPEILILMKSLFLGLCSKTTTTNLPAGLVDPFQFVVNTPGDPQQFRDVMFDGGGTPYEVNFYPNEIINSLLIDSSMKSREERSELDNVKTSVGIAPSPIIAPDIDLVGRERLNDPLVNPNIGGQGSAVF